MDTYLLVANILTFLAFVLHTFAGDRELKLIGPTAGTESLLLKQEKWTMARCGWHWISFDLLFASAGLAAINFSDFFENEKTLLQILTVYFLGYAVVWGIIILISKPFKNNYLKLGQWLLLAVISGLIYMGIN